MDGKDTQDILQRLTKIETLLENMNQTDDLKNRVLEEKIDVANHRIDDLEKANTWLWRTIATSLIAAVVTLLFEVSKLIK
ncbi:hemolysin XhlA family protein [Clostridium beijerinckii]|uniref:hemolysin XhlA family protein n=1 Tax=Clostridium beijerinckii TaxID=1520 RepID=UPI001F3B0D5F|nr:hemolysin XhlA family protein [Clostridium beijerinckii]